METVRTQNEIHIQRYAPDELARGVFDGGRITEIKPVGFPGEGSVPRIGPLFYWAWASSKAPAVIGMHPHEGFEIMSYVLAGQMVHRDTLGTVSTVGEGGAQVMQTGSGVSHQEEVSEGGEFFQIWFEPNLREAMTRPATYREFQGADFPTEEAADGVSVTRLIGGQAPVSLEVDAEMDDLRLAPGKSFALTLEEGNALALVVVEGSGVAQDSEASHAIGARDFVVGRTGSGSSAKLTAGPHGMRAVAIRVPQTVDYPLYPAR